MYIDHSHGPWG
jgi:hypothetical protein